MTTTGTPNIHTVKVGNGAKIHLATDYNGQLYTFCGAEGVRNDSSFVRMIDAEANCGRCLAGLKK